MHRCLLLTDVPFLFPFQCYLSSRRRTEMTKRTKSVSNFKFSSENSQFSFPFFVDSIHCCCCRSRNELSRAERYLDSRPSGRLVSPPPLPAKREENRINVLFCPTIFRIDDNDEIETKIDIKNIF